MSRVLLKKSSVVNKVPVTSTVDAVNGLEYGELAINYADEKLYFRNSANAIKSFSASSGTVTSVAALTLGTTGTDVTSTVANGTTTPVITLNIPTASATNRGALSAADWTTFNSKLSSYTEVDTLATVTGRGATTATAITLSYGTANGVAYLNGSKVLTTGSALVFDGTNLGIGTTSPARTLDVFGYAQIQNPNGSKIAPVVLPKTPTLEIFGGDANENNPGSIGLITPGLNVTAGQVRGSELYFVSSRSTTAQLAALTYTAITTGDNIGRILFGGDNGVNLRAAGATIAGIAGSTWSATNAEGYLTFSTTALNATASGERMRLDSSGNLGIGTTSPQTRLQVDGTNSGATVFSIRLNNTSSTAIGTAVGIEAYTAGINPIGNLQFIRTAASYGASAFTVSTTDTSGGGVLERMRIDSSGNFGIGTTSPSNKFVISNGGLVGLEIQPSGGYSALGGVDILSYNRSTSAYAPLAIITNSSNKSLVVLTSGNVGINTNAPSEKLEVVGNIKHTGLVMTAGTNVDQIYTASDVLTLTTAWQDTSVNSAELTTGSYMVQVYADDSAVGGGQYMTYYTGIMSWYSGDTNEASSDEIILHRAGHASTTGNIFLRVLRTFTADLNNMKLQIAGITTNTGTSTYTYKFRRLI